jgi:hypothetical protein
MVMTLIWSPALSACRFYLNVLCLEPRQKAGQVWYVVLLVRLCLVEQRINAVNGLFTQAGD